MGLGIEGTRSQSGWRRVLWSQQEKAQESENQGKVGGQEVGFVGRGGRTKGEVSGFQGESPREQKLFSDFPCEKTG